MTRVRIYYDGDEYNRSELAKFIAIYRLLEKYHGIIVVLTDVIEKDLREYRSATHNYKDRIIARLKKFTQVLGYYTIDVNIGIYAYSHCNLADAYYKHLQRIKKYAEVMESTKNMIHRNRRRIFELIYPHLVGELEELKNICIELLINYSRNVRLKACYTPYNTTYWLNYNVLYKNMELSKSKKLSKEEFESILNKLINRLKQRMYMKEVEKEYRKQLENQCYPLYDPFCEIIPELLR